MTTLRKTAMTLALCAGFPLAAASETMAIAQIKPVVADQSFQASFASSSRHARFGATAPALSATLQLHHGRAHAPFCGGMQDDTTDCTVLLSQVGAAR